MSHSTPDTPEYEVRSSGIFMKYGDTADSMAIKLGERDKAIAAICNEAALAGHEVTHILETGINTDALAFAAITVVIKKHS